MTPSKITVQNTPITITANIRDYATINELAALSNLQTHNAELIKHHISKEQRFITLKEIARYQTTVLTEAEKIRTNPQELKP